MSEPDTSAPPAPPPRWLAFMPVATFGTIIIGVASLSGGVTNQVKTNTEAIAELKRKADLIDDINIRTARIETKMDALMPGPPSTKEQPR